MKNETEQDPPTLRDLFPTLNEEGLKAVGDVFRGYLEFAWRIFERLEAEGYFKTQEKPDPPEFESPRGSALF